MKRAALTMVLAILLLSLAAMFIAGDACDKVPFMTWTDACLKACDTPPLYNLCQETLLRAPDVAEVSIYALLAARFAHRSYGDTVGTARRLLVRGSVPGGQRPAYQHCIGCYAAAGAQMQSVMQELINCDFTRARKRYADAAAAMESCGRGLSPGTPLVAVNAADKDRTMVAYDLGALIVGK